MSANHHYQLKLEWTGNNGMGTQHYKSYERSYTIESAGKPIIYGSSDVAFRGNAQSYNPEEMLVAAISSCHMLWMLHICSDNGIVVDSYIDHPIGNMELTADDSGKFTQVILQPTITTQNTVTQERLMALHKQAHQKCFIANSVNFPIIIQSSTSQKVSI